MGEVHVNKSDITNIANAIRAQKGQSSSTKYKVSQMPTAIGTLIQPSGTINITSNGTTDVTNYASANVNVPEPSGTISITQNGTVDVSSYANANVNVSSTAVIQDCNSLFQNNWRLSELSTILPLCKPTRTEYMFAYSSSLTSFDGTSLDMSNCTKAQQMFISSGLITISNLDTSNISGTNLYRMFYGCNSLENVDVMNTSKAERLQDVFKNCSSLSNTSLNNILEMCLNSHITFTGYKKLSDIGLSSTQATTCTTLSNWSACQSAGWTTGY